MAAFGTVDVWDVTAGELFFGRTLVINWLVWISFVFLTQLFWNFFLLVQRSSFSLIMGLMMNITNLWNWTAGWNFRLGPKFLIPPFLLIRMRSAQNRGLRILQVYIICLHFGSFLVNVGYCTYSILYIGSYGTKVGTATIDRKYIKWSMCNCYVSSQHECIQEKWEHMTCDVWTTVTLCDIPEHTKTTWIRNGMPPPLKCPGRES